MQEQRRALKKFEAFLQRETSGPSEESPAKRLKKEEQNEPSAGGSNKIAVKPENILPTDCKDGQRQKMLVAAVAQALRVTSNHNIPPLQPTSDHIWQHMNTVQQYSTLGQGEKL